MVEEEKPENNYNWNVVFFIVSIVIWVTDIISFQYWYKAYNHLGWWPSMHSPDPKELGWESHHAMVGTALDIMLVSIFVWLIILIITIKINIKLNPLNLIFGIIGMNFSFYLIFGDFFGWYMD